MKYNIIEARLKRSQLKELAGSLYESNDSSFVKLFNQKGRNAFFGIKNKANEYTLIGSESVYFSSRMKNEIHLDLVEFVLILKKNAMKLQKGGDFEYLETEKGNFIWLHNGAIMCAIWNVVLLINEINAKKKGNSK